MKIIRNLNLQRNLRSHFKYDTTIKKNKKFWGIISNWNLKLRIQEMKYLDHSTKIGLSVLLVINPLK